MSDDGAPGPLLASGRDADIFDLGDGTVLRRSRQGSGDAEREARVMRLVARHGFPAPEVVSAAGRDLVMELVDGPTMLDDVRDHPAKLVLRARTLARLQQRLAEIPAPEWLMAPGWTPDPTGDRVLHLDLHPMNVLMSSDGPVVIDWTNAGAGPAGFDAAMSIVLMSTYQVESTRDTIALKVFVESFRRFRGRRQIEPYVGAACDHRLADRNITPDEREAVAELRTRARRS